jgi:hypothetical protein
MIDYDFFKSYTGLAKPSVMKVICALDNVSLPWEESDASLGLILCRIFENYTSGHKTDVLCDELVMVADEVLNEN